MAQLLQNALYGTALILAAAALRLVLKGRLIPEARLALWGLCLLRLLVPAAPASVFSLWGLLGGPDPAQPPQPYVPPSSPGVTAPQPSQAPQLYVPAVTAPAAGGEALVPAGSGAAFPWGAVLLGLWLAVGLALAARYALSWRHTRRAVANAAPVGRGDPRYLPLPRFARLRESIMEGAPLTFGAVKPTVVLPPELSGEALDCVLAHEGVHARRRDNLWHYAMALALVVHWWNPAVWLMSRLLRRDIELSCDRAAIARLGTARRGDYARVLVSLATAGTDPAFCHTFGRKAAEERIVGIMTYKKTTALGLALSILLVCGVTVAFATKPVETVSEPQDGISGFPGCTNDFVDEETWQALHQQFVEATRLRIQNELDDELGCSPAELAERASCRHPNRTYNRRGIFFEPKSSLVHIKTEYTYWRCNDCGTVIAVPGDMTSESHSFEPVFYAGSNHDLAKAKPSQHFAVYNHTCSDCCGTYMAYTSATGCTQYGCVDVQSVTPEPEVDSVSTPVESASIPDDIVKAELEDLVETLAEECLAKVHEFVTPEPEVDSAAPAGAESGVYDLCADQSCDVPYDHCHIDGEVVRVYYENPGLLCAHPDCDSDAPHEHDGVQYAGKAGRYVILTPELGPVPSAAVELGGRTE